MMRRHNRLLVAFYVLSDALLGMVAFALAYVLRFHSGLIPVWEGTPSLDWHVALLPFIGALVPAAYHVQGLYRLRRGRSRVDDFFAVFVGTILAVVVGIVGTLYYRTYYLPNELEDQGVYEVSRLVWLILIVLNIVAATFPLGRFDMTRTHTYSLSGGSKRLARGLTDRMTITAYFSETEQLGEQFVALERSVIDLLEEDRAASGGPITVRVVHPESSSS